MRALKTREQITREFEFAKSLVDQIPDEEFAWRVLYCLRERFGWAGPVFDRESVNEVIGDDLPQVTDDEWQEIRLTDWWEVLSEASDSHVDWLSYAVEDVLKKTRGEDWSNGEEEGRDKE